MIHWRVESESGTTSSNQGESKVWRETEILVLSSLDFIIATSTSDVECVWVNKENSGAAAREQQPYRSGHHRMRVHSHLAHPTHNAHHAQDAAAMMTTTAAENQATQQQRTKLHSSRGRRYTHAGRGVHNQLSTYQHCVETGVESNLPEAIHGVSRPHC